MNTVFLDGVQLALCIGQRALQVRDIPVLLVYQVPEHEFVLLRAYWSDDDGDRRICLDGRVFSYTVLLIYCYKEENDNYHTTL